MALIRLEASRGDVVPVPRLGVECVCCNEATSGRGQHVVPKGFGVGRTYSMHGGMSVPVCTECRHHAIRRPPAMAGALLTIGVAAFALGVVFDGRYQVPAIVGGIVLVALAIVWTALGTSDEREARSRSRHHPSLAIQIGRGWTQLWTSNPQLVDRMRRMNPTATVRRSRREREAPPTAAPRPTAAGTAQLVQHVLDHELADAYALLLSGTADVIEAQRRLAELDGVIGGVELQRRLRDLREGRPAA